MGKIVYLMGKSASGKDSIFEWLCQQEELSLQPVILYTTRPIRAGEENGREYHFITDEQALELEASGAVIEQRAYETVAGIWKYMTVDDGSFDVSDGDFIAIGTLESYNQIRNYFGDEKLVPILVYVEDGQRLQRALQRERSQKTPRYAELCRRFLADEADFSSENLKAAGLLSQDDVPRNHFENKEFSTCCQEIKEYLWKTLQKD